MICMAKPPSPKKPIARYQIPQKAYDLAVTVPMEIAGDSELDAKIRLNAVQAIRQAIEASLEHDLLRHQKKAFQSSGKSNQVIVYDDETFFANDAHAQADAADEPTQNTHHAEPDDPAP